MLRAAFRSRSISNPQEPQRNISSPFKEGWIHPHLPHVLLVYSSEHIMTLHWGYSRTLWSKYCRKRKWLHVQWGIKSQGPDFFLKSLIALTSYPEIVETWNKACQNRHDVTHRMVVFHVSSLNIWEAVIENL